jgi:hypothetical protein
MLNVKSYRASGDTDHDRAITDLEFRAYFTASERSAVDTATTGTTSRAETPSRAV